MTIRRKKYEDWIKAKPKTNVIERLKKDIRKLRQSNTKINDIFLGSITDSYQPLEETLRLTREKIVLEVNDHGKIGKFVSEEDLKLVFPQEFKALVELNGKFEFLGWWEGTESTWHLDKPLEKSKTPNNINMVLLRRK